MEEMQTARILEQMQARKQKQYGEATGPLNDSAPGSLVSLLGEIGTPQRRPGSSLSISQFALVLAVCGAAFIGYLTWCFGLGMDRQVWLISGVNQPTTVTINGTEHQLEPLGRKTIQLPEGAVTAEFAGETVTGNLSTRFLARPFQAVTFVINADRAAVLRLAATRKQPAHLCAGEAFYTFQGHLPPEFLSGPCDGAWGPPTAEPVVGASILAPVTPAPVRKSPLAHWDYLAHPGRIAEVGAALGWERAADLVRRQLAVDIRNYPLADQLPLEFAPQAFDEALKQTPPQAAAHLSALKLQLRLGQESELREKYSNLRAADPEEGVWLCALAVLETDRKQAEALFAAAGSAAKPCAWASAERSGRRLANADVAGALADARQAFAADPNCPFYREVLEDALAANNGWEELALHLEQRAAAEGQTWPMFLKRINALTAGNQQRAAEALIAAAEEAAPWKEDPWCQAYCRYALSYAAGSSKHAQGFLKVMDRLRPLAAEEIAVLGDWDRLAAVVDAAVPSQPLASSASSTPNQPLPSRASSCPLFAQLYLESHRQGDLEKAQQWLDHLTDRWTAEGMPAERRLAVMIRGTEPLDLRAVLLAPIPAADKRWVMAVFAARFPAQQHYFVAMGQQLNTHRSPPYLYLRDHLASLALRASR